MMADDGALPPACNCLPACLMVMPAPPPRPHPVQVVDEFFQCGGCSKLFWVGPKSHNALAWVGKKWEKATQAGGATVATGTGEGRGQGGATAATGAGEGRGGPVGDGVGREAGGAGGDGGQVVQA